MSGKKNLHNLPLGKILVSPSLLAADFARLGSHIAEVEQGGAELLHLDVMDGHFVPNLSFGIPVIQGIRKGSNMLFDVHLMIEHPKTYVKAFADAGADHITFHVESADDPEETIAEIRKYGCTAGISVKPKTPAKAIEKYLNMIDLVLVMTVEPGFGGQSFMHDQVPKIAELHEMCKGTQVYIEVDGGVGDKTATEVVTAGASVLVAGTGVFRAADGCANAIARLHALSDKLPAR